MGVIFQSDIFGSSWQLFPGVFFNPPGGRTYLHNCTWPKMGQSRFPVFDFFATCDLRWSGEVASPQCGYTKASLCQTDRSWPPDLRWYPPKWTTNNNNLFSSKIHLLFHAPRCYKSYVGWKRGYISPFLKQDAENWNLARLDSSTEMWPKPYEVVKNQELLTLGQSRFFIKNLSYK